MGFATPFSESVLPKQPMEPENHPIEKESHFPKLHF